MPDYPQAFILERHEDVSGVSGTGVVAWGVKFPDGVVALRWDSDWPTSVVFHDRGMEAVEAVHGHQGRTRVVWVDEACKNCWPAPHPGGEGFCECECHDRGPTQREALEFVYDRWPHLTDAQSRLNKVGEEYGEVVGAWVKMHDGTGRKSVADLAQECAQLAICLMALAEAAEFDLNDEIAVEWARANKRVWPTEGREGD